MFNKSKDKLVYSFISQGRDIEVFFAEDGHIEFYNIKRPQEGMYFNSKSDFIYFINSMTDIMEDYEDD